MRWVVMMLAVAMLTACAATKTTTKDAALTGIAAQSDIAFLQRVADNAAYARGITAKGEVTLALDGSEMTLAANIRLYRDTMIRIQVTPMGLMEVARIELTPTHMLIMNRMDREYAEIAYTDVPFLVKHGIDFYTLQSALWAELFVPGEQQLKEAMLPLFTTQIDKECATIAYPASDAYAVMSVAPTAASGSTDTGIAYRWTADAATAQLTALEAAYTPSEGAATSIRCTYSDYAPLGSKRFPTTIALSASGGHREATIAAARQANPGYTPAGGLTLHLKNLTTTTDIEPPTAITDKYRRVTADELLSRVMK